MMVHPDSRRISRVPRYLGMHLARQMAFAYGTITLYGPTFQTVLLTTCFLTYPRGYSHATVHPTTPQLQRL